MLPVAVLTVFLVLNSTSGTDMAGWAVAALWVGWRMLARPGALSFPRPLARILVLPSLLLLVALPGALFHPLADSGKDLWYFFNPILYISFGYLLFEQIGRWQPILQPFLLIGLLTSVYSVVHVYSNRGLLIASESVEGYRQVAGFGFGQAVIPIVLLLFAARAGIAAGRLDRFRFIRVLLYLAGTAATVLSLSRTVILVLAAGWVLSINRRRLLAKLASKGGLGFAGLGVLLVGALTLMSSSTHNPGFFLDKILHTTSEVEIQHYDTFQEINDNWRGFEAYRAFRTYDLLSAREKVMGGGLGTLVDLGFAMPLSPTESLQFIPITHNGYAYILIKTGFLGIALFVLFVLQIGRQGLRTLRSNESAHIFAGLLLLWTALDFSMTQGVITGIYNKSALAPNLLLLGAAYANLRALSRAARPMSVYLPPVTAGVLQPSALRVM